LIRSIVQLCEDIVHVDPLLPPSSHLTAPPKSSSQRRKTTGASTHTINEIHASTKAYPSWWSEIHDSRTIHKRLNSNETVLERNVCFIDTPGYQSSPSFAKETDRVIEYMESLCRRSLSTELLDEGDLLGMLSGNGGMQIDLVLYLFTEGMLVTKYLQVANTNRYCFNRISTRRS
jgi:hypothetical protein